jgi:hypothetical protein
MSHEKNALMGRLSDEERARLARATGPACCMLSESGLCMLEMRYGAMPAACRSFAVGGPDCLEAREKAELH